MAILERFSNHTNLSDTIGCLTGSSPDVTDPDKYDAENVGFDQRQLKYCSNSKDAKEVTLSDNLVHGVSSMNLPIPSNTRVTITLTRNSDELLVTQTGSKHDNFRIKICKLELQVPRYVIVPQVNARLDQKISMKHMQILFNRYNAVYFFELREALIKNSITFFTLRSDPPIFKKV